MRRILLTVLTVVMAGTMSFAATFTYTSEGAFTAASGATLQTLTQANATTVGIGPGNGTIVQANGFGVFVNNATFGNVMPGDEFVVSGVETLFSTLTLSPLYSFGIAIFEPTSTGTVSGCNTTCVDSTFKIELFNGATLVYSWTGLTPTNDALSFYGLHSSQSFNKVVITEVTGSNDNEYFGRVYLGQTPVPEPTTMALLGSGLVGVWLRRRK